MRLTLRVDYDPASWKQEPVGAGAELFHSPSCLHVSEERFSLFPSGLKARHSKAEAAHFFGANIQGERFGMDALRASPEAFFDVHGLAEYRRRLLAEEEDHSSAFRAVANELGFRPAEQSSLFGRCHELKTETDLALLFANIFVFEHVTTQLSARIMKDKRVDPAIRGLHRYHWEDERNHLLVTRNLLTGLAATLAGGDRIRLLEATRSWGQVLARVFFPAQAIQETERALGEPLIESSLAFSRQHPVESVLFRNADSVLSSIFAA
jgi:hypothetical protein